MPLPVAGVMGAGEGALSADKTNAFELGKLLAQAGWVVLSGGRDVGVMREVNRGAKSVGGFTVGILPSSHIPVSPDLDLVIVTEMQQARNNINVLTSHVVIACGTGGAGTVSEVALALKASKPVLLLGSDELTQVFFRRLAPDLVHPVATPQQAVTLASRFKPGS